MRSAQSRSQTGLLRNVAPIGRRALDGDDGVRPYAVHAAARKTTVEVDGSSDLT